MRPTLDRIHRQRLEWMAKAKRGELMPRDLFNTDEFGNGWNKAVSETAQAVLDYLDNPNHRK